LELNKNVNWTKPEDLHPFKGLFKIFIIPPDDLYLPVIPENIHGKLVDIFLKIFILLINRSFIYAEVVPLKHRLG